MSLAVAADGVGGERKVQASHAGVVEEGEHTRKDRQLGIARVIVRATLFLKCVAVEVTRELVPRIEGEFVMADRAEKFSVIERNAVRGVHVGVGRDEGGFGVEDEAVEVEDEGAEVQERLEAKG